MDVNRLRTVIWGNQKTGNTMIKQTTGRPAHVQNRIQSLAANLKDRSQSALEAGRDGVRRWPLATVASALVAGALLDRLVLRR